MLSPTVTQAIERWNLTLPPLLLQALGQLQKGDEIGVWRLDLELIDPNVLDAGGPINLFPIGTDGLNDYLCLAQDPFDDSAPSRVVLWSPMGRQLVRLGRDFGDFLEKEAHRRLDFLLERGQPIAEEDALKARSGQAVEFPEGEGDAKLVAEMIAEVVRIAGKLSLNDSIDARATGKAGPPDFLREVDGRDEAGIEKAIDELRQSALEGDAGAAFEVVGFLQLRQKFDEAARWALTLSRCAMFGWPSLSGATVGKVADLIKANAAAVAPVDRLDPLFTFLTTQPPAKWDGRMNLSRQYLRKKDYPAAVREAENALRLAPATAGDDVSISKAMVSAYELLVEIFKAAQRPREQAYAELMLQKTPRIP